MLIGITILPYPALTKVPKHWAADLDLQNINHTVLYCLPFPAARKLFWIFLNVTSFPIIMKCIVWPKTTDIFYIEKKYLNAYAEPSRSKSLVFVQTAEKTT